MRFIVFYRKERDYTQDTEDLLQDLSNRYQKSFEIHDPDTPSGSSEAHAYDIMDFPTFLAVMDDGREAARFSGLPLPTVQQLADMFVIL
ncbi:MAG: hypothetical protein LBM12_01585 [Candidatus Nomurabacteria bacterium]|jgi:thiol-disulfide isomerase/thioredoxin|nr:hypothetical protein [Candidatus Nomurabacteria bacterium]